MNLQVRHLKLDLDKERKKAMMNSVNDSQQIENKIPELQLLEIQREWQNLQLI